MESIRLNDKLQLSGLDSFREMNESEIAGMRIDSKGEGVVMTDPEHHIMISAAWKKAGGLFGRLLGENDLVRNMETTYRKAFKPYGFALEDYLERTIAGDTAKGLRYTYHVKDTDMTGESFAIKKDHTIYNFHVYYRTALVEESRKIWYDILDQAEWK